MSDHEDIAHFQELLQTHRRTLVALLRQCVALGGLAHAPPGVVMGIDEAASTFSFSKCISVISARQ